MMSSEEEADCFGLYGDKLLKKAKRSRQRVDAGEPRNSYSSIPNFSSRPSFLSGGLYGALFSQNHQHLGLLSQGPFGPTKMLNELLGRQVKQAQDASTPAVAMDAPGPDGPVNFDCLNTTPVIRRGLEEENSPPPGDVAHHMLRDILQGRKKELMALEQELRTVSVSGNNEPPSPDNNNSITNNNNNNNNDLKNNALMNGSDLTHVSSNCQEVKPVLNGVVKIESANCGEESVNLDEGMSEEEGSKMAQRSEDDGAAGSGQGSDSEQSIASPAGSDSAMNRNIKDDPDEPGKDSAHKSEHIELKRARVENIVSSMRSSPSLPTQVNGCKKRKLYHPQQHEAASDRYSSVDTINAFMDDDTGDNNSMDTNEIRQKKVEKDALKSQLRTMQEQLAEMQQKYVQLCTRMDQDSECPDGEDISSDIEPDNNSLSLPEKPIKVTTPPPKDTTPTPMPTTPTQSAMSPAITKMISSKIQPPHLNTHQMPLAPNFNGALSLLQQQVLQEQHGLSGHHHSSHHHHPQLPHQAISSAAVMYHKLFMEQEARLNKEAVIAAEQQLHHPHIHPQSGHPGPTQPPHSQMGSQPATPGPAGSQPPTTPAPSSHGQPNHNSATPQPNQQSPSQQLPKPSDFTDRLNMLRNSLGPVSGADLEGLADVLKSEISSSLSNLIDSIMSRFVQQKRYVGKQSEAAAEQLNKDILLASQLLDRKSPRTKVIDRGNTANDRSNASGNLNVLPTQSMPPRINGTVFPSLGPSLPTPTNNSSSNNSHTNSPENNLSSSVGARASSGEGREGAPEQNEALSLVVVPKKKRHKVTDTRITPRTVSRILAQDGLGSSQPVSSESGNKFGSMMAASTSGGGGSESPPPSRSYSSHPSGPPPPPPPPPILPVSLPTSVAIPNPSLHESKVFSPYSPFYHGQHLNSGGGAGSGSPVSELRDSPPLAHPPSLLHPALLAAAQHAASPDYSGMRVSSMAPSQEMDRSSDCNSGDAPYDCVGPTISFYNNSNTQSSTLTPMHLRKAKLMFFWVRYPSSAVLKMYFPDIKFNKNNTAQLVKWFSNFREFYYIQMEKYARQAVSEGVKSPEDLHVSGDCEIYRVLNLHYNRNNHIEVPPNFRYVVEQTLREFFKAIQTGKDTEQSWKKSIYKIISRLDDPVPEYFKSPNFLEQLE